VSGLQCGEFGVEDCGKLISFNFMGGQAKVDRFLEKTQGNGKSLMGEQVEMKSKAAALFFTREFLKGSATANPLGFDGLELRLTGSQVINCGSTVGGDALTLDKLDELLDGVQGGADVLYMNKTMRRKVNKLMRSAGQAMEMVSDSFGRPIYAYAGVPIGIIDVDNAYDPILAFDEDDCTDAEAACTSVYAVRFGVDGVCGLQAGPLQVLPLADENVWKKVDTEWYCTPAIFHPRAAARLRGIKNA